MVLCISRIVQPPSCDATKSQREPRRCNTQTHTQVRKRAVQSSKDLEFIPTESQTKIPRNKARDGLEPNASWLRRWLECLVSCLSISPFRNLGASPLKIQSLRTYFEIKSAGPVGPDTVRGGPMGSDCTCLASHLLRGGAGLEPLGPGPVASCCGETHDGYLLSRQVVVPTGDPRICTNFVLMKTGRKVSDSSTASTWAARAR